MRNFRNYRVWQQAIELVVHVYDLTRQLPQTETYALSNQVQRAAVSIPSNIAEGCARTSERDFKRFVEIALGSAYEVETQLILADRLYSIGEHAEYAPVLMQLNIVQAKLNALRNKLL
jgi:four helix bundle protein